MGWFNRKPSIATRKRVADLLVVKAWPLVQLWKARMDCAALAGDVDKCKRILRHIYRIRALQAKAQVARDA